MKQGMTAEQAKTIPPDDAIQQTLEIVFPYDFPVWDGMTVEKAKEIILRHYYMREIGWETVPLWQYQIYTKLSEEMPFIVDIANKIKEMGSIFENDIHSQTENREHTENETANKDTTTTTTNTENVTGADTDTTEGSSNSQEMFSDTPQDGLSDVIEGRYLTEATVNSTNSNTTVTKTNKSDRMSDTDVTGNVKDTRGLTGQEKITLQKYGFVGDKIDTLDKWNRVKLIPILMMIRAVADQFMGIL